MHPILSHFRRLATYLIAWVFVAILLAYWLTASGALRRGEALVLSLPLCLVYAFVCLSAWYSCRVTPLDKSGFSRLATTHLTAAVVAAALWVLASKALTIELSEAGYFPGLDRRFSPEIPLLLGTGILLYLFSVALYYVILSFEASREAEARALEASVLAREAELKALKAQVNPHFLFNSLNSISALTASDPGKAREMCILLGDFLRRTLGLGEKAFISVEEELSLIHAFLAVEKIRFGARLRMEEAIDPEALAKDIPPLLLQPLVENAVGHGVANLVDGGRVQLEVRCREHELSLRLENEFDPEAPPRRRNGVGLVNVRQRLQARYGHRAFFEAKAEGNLFHVAITLPAEREGTPS